MFCSSTILIFVQLLIGATMRHQHAGLAISDFPLAYGKIWPDTSAAAVAGYNAHRVEINGEEARSPRFRLFCRWSHRLVALAIFILVGVCGGGVAGVETARRK